MNQIIFQNLLKIKSNFVKLFFMAAPTCFAFGMYLLSGFLNEGPTSQYENTFIHFNDFSSSITSIICLIFFGLSILFYVSFVLGFISSTSIKKMKIRQIFKLFTDIMIFIKYLVLVIIYFVVLFACYCLIVEFNNLLSGIGNVIITFLIIPGIFITFNNLIILFYNYNIENHAKNLFKFLKLYFKMIFSSILEYMYLICIFTGIFIFTIIIFFLMMSLDFSLLSMISETILNGLFYVIVTFCYALGCIAAVWFNLVIIDLNKKTL